MRDPKKFVTMIILLVIVLASVVFGIKRIGNAPKPPKHVLERVSEKIDKETLELISQPIGDWVADGDRDGKCKNPKTGKFSMVDPIICASCGQKIPPVDLPRPPKSSEARFPDWEAEAAAKEAWEDETERILREYMCPRCGDPAY